MTWAIIGKKIVSQNLGRYYIGCTDVMFHFH